MNEVFSYVYITINRTSLHNKHLNHIYIYTSIYVLKMTYRCTYIYIYMRVHICIYISINKPALLPS